MSVAVGIMRAVGSGGTGGAMSTGETMSTGGAGIAMRTSKAVSAGSASSTVIASKAVGTSSASSAVVAGKAAVSTGSASGAVVASEAMSAGGASGAMRTREAVGTIGTICTGAAIGVAYGAASITVAVNARVDSVGGTGAVWAVNTLSTAAETVASGVAEVLTTSIRVDSWV